MYTHGNPFRDPTSPFLDPNTPGYSPGYGPGGAHMAAASGSRSDLLASGQDIPMNNLANPYTKYDDPNAKRPTWMENSPGSKPSKVSRKTSASIGIFVILIVIICVAVPLGLRFMRKHVVNTSPSNKVSADGLYNTSLIPRFPSPIDPDTPQDALTSKSVMDDTEYVLVFSDEFNVDGRSFYPGDDPYWEGVNFHYWQTGDLEWYEPGQITTKNGALEITLAKYDDISINYNMSYRSGMMSTWNNFCFTGGRYEANVMLPGSSNIVGLWPAVWAMGNLGRVGYGASLEGLWPYTYDSCDVGTLPNQTLNGLPEAATVNGDPKYNGVLSFLQGQRLSRCTCEGESHPGPMHSDGSFVGRAAPEIDMFEATVDGMGGVVSHTCQMAPFDDAYAWANTSDTFTVYNSSITSKNGWSGDAFQEELSFVSQTNQECYEKSANPCFSVYGFEYKPGFDNGYITWLAQGVRVWTMMSGAIGKNDKTQIDARPIPQEPMYLIANLGISEGFGAISPDLVFPTVMRIDYIRVYQPKDQINVGCDPAEFPTKVYIEKYKEAYANPNLTTWVDDYHQKVPKNKLVDQC